jgi:hypothetical protein
VAIALGILLFVVQTRRHPEAELSVYREDRGPKSAGVPKAEEVVVVVESVALVDHEGKGA